MPNKYHAIRTELDGYTFDSQKEAKRYGELKLLERAGEITELEIHPNYELAVKDKVICVYIADFSYIENGKRVIEDVKGVKTAVYRLKKKLFEAIHGIEIQET